MPLTSEQMQSIEGLAKWVIQDNDIKPFAIQIEEYLSGMMPEGSVFILDPAAASLNVPKTDYTPLVMTLSTIRKIRAEHEINENVIKNLPEIISENVLAMDSLTHKNSVVLVTQLKDFDNNELIIAVQIDKKMRDWIINEIPSLYGKEDLAYLLENTHAAGLDFYLNSRTADWLRHSGLSLSEGLTNRLYNDYSTKFDGFDVNKKPSIDHYPLGEKHAGATSVQFQMQQFGDKERFAPDEIQTPKSIGIPDCLKTSRESNFTEEIEIESNTEYTLEPFIVDNLSTQAVLFAEPITSGRCGVVEVSLNGNLGRDDERVINVVYDYNRRANYEDDWAVIKEAIESWCPDEPWVKFGLDNDVQLEGWGEHISVLNWVDDLATEDLCNLLNGIAGTEFNVDDISLTMEKACQAEQIRDAFWYGMVAGFEHFEDSLSPQIQYRDEEDSIVVEESQYGEKIGILETCSDFMSVRHHLAAGEMWAELPTYQNTNGIKPHFLCAPDWLYEKANKFGIVDISIPTRFESTMLGLDIIHRNPELKTKYDQTKKEADIVRTNAYAQQALVDVANVGNSPGAR